MTGTEDAAPSGKERRLLRGQHGGSTTERTTSGSAELRVLIYDGGSTLFRVTVADGEVVRVEVELLDSPYMASTSPEWTEVHKDLTGTWWRGASSWRAENPND